MAVWFLSAADRYIILHYRSVEEVGLYSVGNKLTQVMTLLAMAVQMSYGPLVVSRFESDLSPGKSETKKFLSQSWRLYIVAAISISVFLSVFGYEIIRVLAPPAYLAAILVIPFLTISKVLSQSIQMTCSGLELYQKTKHFSWIIPLAAGITIALNFLLIPVIGFMGASIVSLAGNIIQLLISHNISQHYFRVNWRASSVAFYLALSLILAMLCPVSEICFDFHFPLVAKLLFFLGGLVLPLLTGVVKRKAVLSISEKLAVKFHELRKPER
jgi:O-antigen/teichoic acid export membrane protein